MTDRMTLEGGAHPVGVTHPAQALAREVADFNQNAKDRTVASACSVRATADAQGPVRKAPEALIADCNPWPKEQPR